MKKRPDNIIDELYNEAFKDFHASPSPHVWDDIKQSVGKESNKGKIVSFFSYKSLIIVMATILAVGTGFAINYIVNSNDINKSKYGQNTTDKVEAPHKYVVNENSDIKTVEYDKITKPKSQKNIEARQSNISDLQNEVKAVKNKNAKKETKVDKSAPKNIAKIDNEIKLVDKTGKDVIDNIVSDVSNKGNNKIEVNNEDKIVNSEEEISHNYNDIANKEKYKNSNSNVANSSAIDTVISGDLMYVKPDYVYRNRVSFGAHITPDMIFNLSNVDGYLDNESVTQSTAYDMTLNFHVKNITFGSGLGYSFYNQKSYYEIDYLRHFEDNSIEPIEETSQEILQYNMSFINIPVFVKYQYFISNKFSTTANVGMMFSWAMDKEDNRSIVFPEYKEIISVDRMTPETLNNNYKLMLSSSFDYQLTNSLKASVEPMFKYYISDYYKESTLKIKKPYSVGLRMGFYLRF